MEQEHSPHLSEYYYLLRKHKGIIITSLVIIVTLTMLFTFLSKPVYKATTTMVIENEQSTSPLTGERVDYESYLSQSLTFKTHFKLITSRAVLEKVIKDLKLDQLEREDEMEIDPWRKILSQIRENLRLLMGREDVILSPEEKMGILYDRLINKISIEEVRDTRLLKIGVEDHDPLMARDIANGIARHYIEFNITNRLKYSQNTLSWMTDQLYEIKKKLEDAEQEFLEYKRNEKLFSVEGKQNVINQKIQEFNDSYLETRNKRLALDATLAELSRTLNEKGDILHARTLINNALIDNLYSQLIEMDVELSRLSKVYKPMHPKIVQVKTKRDNTNQKLKQEIEKAMESIRSERKVLLSRETVLQDTMDDFENDALDTNKKELKYTILQRNVETNRNIYDTLLSKVKETNITGTIDASNVRVTEEAIMPMNPVKPKKRLNLTLAIIFGLMTGVGLAFFLEYLDRSLRTEEDVRRYLDLPVLTVIPVADKLKSGSHAHRSLKPDSL